MNIGTALALAGLTLSLVTSIIAVTAVIVQMRTNVQRLNDREKTQDAREDAAAKEVGEFIGVLKAFMAEQTIINKTVSAALDGVVKKLEDVQKTTIESSTVVSLLTEVLKKKAPAGMIDQE
jgi:uncharacterized coiled-coil protein SlyX